MVNVKKSVAERTRHKRHAIESKNSNSEHALNKSVNESSGTESRKQDTSSTSGNYLTHVVDAAIRLVNDQVPSVEQKDASFQSNKLGKNQDAPKFCGFFEINDLKAQLQAKTTLICNLKNQIKSVKEASNEAKVKNDINVIETINIELEHSVAKLLAANEQLHKENTHLKQTYKELYDSIKKTPVQNKENNDSLISQINQKSVENGDLKAQIQENVFANAALKNELQKLKGNNVDTKFVKASILGKPPLQPSRNQSVIRQPNAFKSERPRISKLSPPSRAVSLDPVVVTAPRAVDPVNLPLSTTIDQDVPSASTSPINPEIQSQVINQGVEEQNHGHQYAQFNNAPYLRKLSTDLSSEETTL
ncbi:hypothetical protein Tco_0588101 [Tanacetum coccineum]